MTNNIKMTNHQKSTLDKLLFEKLGDLATEMITSTDERDYMLFGLLLDEMNKTYDLTKTLNKKAQDVDKDSQK